MEQMDPMDEEMENEDRIETKRKNIFELVPATRSRPKKKHPPTTYGICNSEYDIVDKNTNETMKRGPLILL